MLTANVGFLAIPAVVISNLDGTSLTNVNQVIVFTSPSMIASSLSVEASIGSIVIGLLLTRHNRTKQKEDPAGAVSKQSSLTFVIVTSGQSTYLYQNSHPVFGLQPMAIILSLPWALLMWSYALSCSLRRYIRLTFGFSPPWIGWWSFSSRYCFSASRSQTPQRLSQSRSCLSLRFVSSYGAFELLGNLLKVKTYGETVWPCLSAHAATYSSV